MTVRLWPMSRITGVGWPNDPQPEVFILNMFAKSGNVFNPADPAGFLSAGAALSQYVVPGDGQIAYTTEGTLRGTWLRWVYTSALRPPPYFSENNGPAMVSGYDFKKQYLYRGGIPTGYPARIQGDTSPIAIYLHFATREATWQNAEYRLEWQHYWGQSVDLGDLTWHGAYYTYDGAYEVANVGAQDFSHATGLHAFYDNYPGPGTENYNWAIKHVFHTNTKNGALTGPFYES